MEIIILGLVVIAVYYFMVYLTTKSYINRVEKELTTKFKSIIAFLCISIVYILFTFISVKVFNYGSTDITVNINISWLATEWPSVKFNTVSVLIAVIFQALINITYVYLSTLFVKSNIKDKLKRNVGMLLFYIFVLANIAMLSLGYYGFLRGNKFDSSVLRLISDITIFSSIALYPIIMYKDLIIKKRCKSK